MSNPAISLRFSETLTPTIYASQRYKIILPLEQFDGKPSLNVYVDSAGIPTIGAGFNIRSQASSILRVILGRDPTRAEIDAITTAASATFSHGSRDDDLAARPH